MFTNSGSPLWEFAPNEFELVFGDIVRGMDEDSGDGKEFYGHFLGEFLKGVTYALENPDADQPNIEAETVARYFLSPPEGLTELEPESVYEPGRGSSLVFRYGAYWALDALQHAKG